ncbi:hypothetical protein KOM00_19145 [Geomonas sp. Red69]|uniref:hypothetical protein n=1 Tax=Geomonas diazotrophica TaxID=2843197 RepID=UPI001C12837D|nr:hypothetical protein [Geomonas diazotrophica]MBU5638845.1 hypothetical protein [Geomonas diazotrophica]
MGEQLFLERFVWFDNETRHGRYPNAFKLAAQFEISTKTAQRSIDYFRDRLQAPLEYLLSHKGYRYADSSFQLPMTRMSEGELLALLISRKLITEASSAGSLAQELETVSRRLGSLLAANLPGRTKPDEAFSFRLKGSALPIRWSFNWSLRPTARETLHLLLLLAHFRCLYHAHR